MNSFLKGFVHAWNGIVFLIRNERNFRVHIAVLLLVITLGWCFSITRTEWLVIILISCLVLALEGINTAIERLCDLYSISLNEQIKVIKDVAAGAVLIAAIGAVIVGAVIFVPYIISNFL